MDPSNLMTLVNGPESYIIYKYVSYVLALMVWLLSYPAIKYITKSGRLLDSMESFFNSESTIDVVVKLNKLAQIDFSVLDKLKNLELDSNKIKKLLDIASKFGDIENVEEYIKNISRNMKALVTIVETEIDNRDIEKDLEIKRRRKNIDDAALSILEEKYNDTTSGRRERLNRL